MLITISSCPAAAQDAEATRLRQAAQFISAGNFERAEAELQSVLNTSPKEYRALDLLGVVRILQHRETDAEILFDRSIQSNPNFASSHSHLGLLFLQAGREDDAIPELQTALRLDPARADASDALVHILRKTAEKAASNGDSKQALGLLIEARKLAPNNPDVEVELATAALNMSLFQDAIAGFRETLAQRPDDWLAVYGLGRAYGGLGKLDQAQHQFVRYISLRPDDPSGFCSLGITLAALGRTDEASDQFHKSILLAPQQTEAYFRLALLNIKAGNWDSARTNLQHVLDRDPKHAGALSGLGRVEFMQKRYAQAAELLQRAVASDDSLLDAHYYLGRTYSRLGKESDSEREFQKVSELQHTDVEKRRAVSNQLDIPPPASVANPNAP